MIIPGCFYRHPRMIDVDIYVTESTLTSNGVVAHVMYWNRAWRNFHWGVDEILIKTEDIDSWKTLSMESTPPKAS
jgi:hypothetical protein